MSENEIEDKVECSHCLNEVDENEVTETTDGDVCETCRDDNYSTCEDCGDVVLDDAMMSIGNGSSYVCDPCFNRNYFTCGCCEEATHDDYSVCAGDETICQHCRDYNYSYCEDCDDYYHHDSDYSHEHGTCSDDCSSPAQTFRLATTDGPLANDVRVTASLPSGFVTDEGIGQIAKILRSAAPDYVYHPETGQYDEAIMEVRNKWFNLSYGFADGIGNEWQTKDGNFTKRLSRYAYKSFGLKVTPEILTQVGNVGRDHSNGSDFEVEITRDLNLPAEDFAHEDSCWWQSYHAGRCALKTNGGFGLRSFEDKEYPEYGYVKGPWAYDLVSYQPTGRMVKQSSVEGRAWVMPLRVADHGGLVATFDAENADAFVVFNAYGALSGYASARIMAGLVGMTYRKVNLDIDPMYINNDNGYLVASEEIADRYTDGRLNIDVQQHSNLYYNESRTLANV